MIKKGFFYFFCIAVLSNCNKKGRVFKLYESDNCSSVYHSISYGGLIDSLSYYNNKLVEVSGYYHYSIEQTALSKHRSFKEPVFWVEFNSEIARKESDTMVYLIESVEEYRKINSKEIIMRGVVDTSNHGHLGQYIGTLKNVCFLKVID